MEYSLLDVLSWLNRHTIRRGLQPLSFKMRLQVLSSEFYQIFWPEPPKLVKIGDPEHWQHHFYDFNRRQKQNNKELLNEYEKVRKAFYAYLTSDGQAELDMVIDRDTRRRHFDEVKPIKQLEENGRYAYRRANFYTYKKR